MRSARAPITSLAHKYLCFTLAYTRHTNHQTPTPTLNTNTVAARSGRVVKATARHKPTGAYGTRRALSGGAGAAGGHRYGALHAAAAAAARYHQPRDAAAAAAAAAAAHHYQHDGLALSDHEFGGSSDDDETLDEDGDDDEDDEDEDGEDGYGHGHDGAHDHLLMSAAAAAAAAEAAEDDEEEDDGHGHGGVAHVDHSMAASFDEARLIHRPLAHHQQQHHHHHQQQQHHHHLQHGSPGLVSGAPGAAAAAAAPGGSRPDWLPHGGAAAGSAGAPFRVGSGGRSRGLSPAGPLLASTPPFGRSVDMADVCARLMMEGGAGEKRVRCSLSVLARRMRFLQPLGCFALYSPLPSVLTLFLPNKCNPIPSNPTKQPAPRATP